MKCCHGTHIAAGRHLSAPVDEAAVVQVQAPSVRRRVLSGTPVPAIFYAASAAKFDGGIDGAFIEINKIQFSNRRNPFIIFQFYISAYLFDMFGI